jgi:hypothetical protein
MININIQNFIDRGLNPQYASQYERFGDEYDKLANIKPLDGIQNRMLRMYAVDQSTKIDDITETLDKLKECLPSIRKICNKPKSHLKSINEIRPIDTVKRVGYESIPYLASHSEDWLARTATGLKPARLFSRVEEEDFQIYENRVVKTLIDKVCNYLKNYIQDLEYKYHQMEGILHSGMKTHSFGFDKGFQIAVSKLIPNDYLGDSKKQVEFERAEKLLKESKNIKNKYYDLKKSGLYKLLSHIKAVTNPLNETNILLLDRDYRKVFILWKEIQRRCALKKNDELKEKIVDVQKPYRNFINVIIQFTMDSLNFKEKNCRFERNNISVCINEENSAFRLNIKDIKKRELEIGKELVVPVNAGETSGKFSFDGTKLCWENDTTDDEIEVFCKKLKEDSKKQEKNNEQNRRYSGLKSAIIDTNRKAGKIKEINLYIIPICCKIEDDELNVFKNCLRKETTEKDCINIIALPMVTQNEQNLTDYMINTDDNFAILPLSLFDINSYRRLQKIIIRHIIEFDTDKCPYCGFVIKKMENGHKCVNCDLIITNTICPNEKCRHNYKYFWYSTKEEKIKEMYKVSDDDFFNKDSLFQYKDIVDMEVKKVNGEFKLIPICPKCKKK